MAVSQEEILETISNMTVMQVVDLISAMEEKFGVSAAAAVAVAAPRITSYNVCYTKLLRDDAIAEQPDIFFEAGDHEQLIHVSAEAFNVLLGENVQHGRFSQ